MVRPIPLAAVLLCAATGLQAQTPQLNTLLSKMTTSYRAASSFSASGKWTRKVGEKTMTGNVKLMVQRPNKLVLDLQGDKVNTLVQSDGATLIALRPDRKAYTKTLAPATLISADILRKIEVPTPASKITALLLQANLRGGDSPLARRIATAELSEPQGFGSKLAHLIKFQYDDTYEARVYVTTDDNLVRRVDLYKDGSREIREDFTEILINQDISADVFKTSLPDGAIVVASLPPLETVEVAATGPMAHDFTLDTVDGEEVKLSKLRGKVVLLNFYFNN